jgi:chemotaxis protein CheY-P-specific phosphatase CheC
MNADDNELMMKVFSSIFEDFAFMFVEEALDLETNSVGKYFRAKIEFKSKSEKGYLEVVAPEEFCDETAENILGTEVEELPTDAGENALKELLNISCGYFLSEKFGTNEVFDLSIPSANPVSQKEWDLLFNNRQHITFLVDESPVLARFVIV